MCNRGWTISSSSVEAGNIKSTQPDLATFQKGETVIGILWDYLALEYRDQLEGQVNLEIVVPEDASIAGPYASIINKYAPHPYAARLMRNYILSPEGQALYAEGYATPILPDIEIPAEVAAKRPSAEAYASVRTINDWNQGFIAFQQIADEWGPVRPGTVAGVIAGRRLRLWQSGRPEHPCRAYRSAAGGCRGPPAGAACGGSGRCRCRCFRS